MNKVSHLKTKLFGLVAVLALSTAAIAAPTGAPKYEGTFQLQPHVMHTGTISGKMDLLYNDVNLTQVKLALDHPVMGLANVVSAEQWATPLSTATSDAQTVYAFRLMGPPHGWYFVMVLVSSDGGQTLQGTIYKANSKLVDIQNLAKSPISALPAGWKAIGTSVLKTL